MHPRHDITEILLKVMLSTINSPSPLFYAAETQYSVINCLG